MLLLILFIARRQIDYRLIRSPQTIRVVVDILYLSVGNRTDIVRQTTLGTWNLQQAVLKALVGEILIVRRVHHTHPVNNKAVGVHIRGCWSEGHLPYALCIFLHGITTCKLYIDQYFLGIGIVVLERYFAILMTFISWLCKSESGATQK